MESAGAGIMGRATSSEKACGKTPCPGSTGKQVDWMNFYCELVSERTERSPVRYIHLVPSEHGRADLIRTEAHRLGFLACGFARAEFLADEAPRLEKWLREDRHGKMGYMANHFDLRLDPRKLVPGAKSVISLAYNYFAEPAQIPEAPKLSTYAYGRDYHKVVKQRLKPLMEFIKNTFGDVEMRSFVDSAPVMEKAWAQRAGIGWAGKNANVILSPIRNTSTRNASTRNTPTDNTPTRNTSTRNASTDNTQLAGGGSFFFLCEIITDLELEPDAPATDHCGTCRRCIDACPTGAIIRPYVVDGSKCISYFTIELKEAIPQEMKGRFDNWVFGCDICQQVCPWNRFSKPHNEPEFKPKEKLMALSRDEWHGMTEVLFEELFQASAVKRTKYEGLKRNLGFLGLSTAE
jgi:epoxyqueuosine reductase